MTNNKLVTRDTIRDMLANSNRRYVEVVIGRALVAIYGRQTREERAIDESKAENGIGFTSADANDGSRIARYYIEHGRLLEWQINLWRKVTKTGYPRLCKYARQLNEVAEERQLSHTRTLSDD